MVAGVVSLSCSRNGLRFVADAFAGNLRQWKSWELTSKNGEANADSN